MVCLRDLSDVPIKNLYGSRQRIMAYAILFLMYHAIHLKFLAYPRQILLVVGEGGRAKLPNCVKRNLNYPYKMYKSAVEKF